MRTRSTSDLPASLILAASIFFTSHLPAGDRQRVLAVSHPSSELSLTFIGGSIVDAGTMASRGKRKPATTKEVVTMRIGPPSQESRGTATLRAFLETHDPRCIVRIDGVVLTTAPRIIQRHAPIGIPFSHRIEIEVPLTARDGALHTSIGWEITTE